MSSRIVRTFAADCLADRVAVVTGAAGGLGVAIGGRLAAMGARVVLLDLPAAVAGRAVGDGAVWLACDISDEDDVARAACATLERCGRCDILVNNAAFIPPGAPLESLTKESWDRVQQVNLTGAFLCAKHFAADMLARGSGSIVNVTSISATLPNASGAYGPSKAGLLALTRQMAVEWGPRGVRANAVSPGLVRTPMSEHFYGDPVMHARRAGKTALRRIASPHDIADVVAFLASDASAYVTGQEILVDGGFSQTALMEIQVR